MSRYIVTPILSPRNIPYYVVTDTSTGKGVEGYIYCPLTWSGRTCEECMEIFERRMEREDGA